MGDPSSKESSLAGTLGGIAALITAVTALVALFIHNRSPNSAPVIPGSPNNNGNNGKGIIISPPPPHVRHEYKLIFRDHYNGGTFWEVRHTNTAMTDVGNDLFKSWCVPFDQTRYIVLTNHLVAGDEQFKEQANWWTAPPYNLPALNPQWLHKMDDEKWYFMEVQPK